MTIGLDFRNGVDACCFHLGVWTFLFDRCCSWFPASFFAELTSPQSASITLIWESMWTFALASADQGENRTQIISSNAPNPTLHFWKGRSVCLPGLLGYSQLKPLLSCCVSSSWWPVWLLCFVSYFLFPNHLQASVNHIYLVTDMIWNEKEPRFSLTPAFVLKSSSWGPSDQWSSLCLSDLGSGSCLFLLHFLVALFSRCDFIPTLEWCFMYSKSQIQTLLNMSSVSGKLISLITNKAGNRSFFWQKRIFGSWKYIFKMHVSQGSLLEVSQGYVQFSGCSKLREIPSSCDGGMTDGWQKHFWRRLLLVWKGYLRKHINSHALYKSLPMFFHYKNI